MEQGSEFLSSQAPSGLMPSHMENGRKNNFPFGLMVREGVYAGPTGCLVEHTSIGKGGNHGQTEICNSILSLNGWHLKTSDSLKCPLFR